MSKGVCYLFLSALIVLTLYGLFFGPYNLQQLSRLEKARTALEEKRKKLAEENSQLENQLSSMRRNPDFYIERFLRETLGMQRKDETIVILER
ncbi:Septum formation initiator [Thermocrinis albus DSM 14484]|uniref:Septum formation initiator n=1 Tax=Thermocrinis albus (strain DSM 14484 / JCM 11386 / HI 11/12) TaxID=638303 RepID=D3SPX1_THEAH|nr:septum formation initiator family protein [Thermocrinis albus]ADC89208.1 Septum formation initiator [Thermocrinis albus DSM 14484]